MQLFHCDKFVNKTTTKIKLPRKNYPEGNTIFPSVPMGYAVKETLLYN